MKISKVDHIVGVTGEWRESEHATHVPLPLDASAVPDAMVVRVARSMCDHLAGEYDYILPWTKQDDFGRATYLGMSRAAIAALAQALAEEGTRDA
jgi:hypothetical protein